MAARIGGRQVDETTLSRLRNDNRFDSGGVLEGVGERLQAFDLTRADEDGVLIVDGTIAERAGENIEGVRPSKTWGEKITRGVSSGASYPI